MKEVNGYRVQILATKNIETASLYEQEATERLQGYDHKTYLIFEAPLYKIRVGDCKTRLEAESVREIMEDYGYRETFIVKSKIRIME
ncbi:MAG: SPOR domain-containing protein [Calditrichales bacterium]|nr:MAG: SPOR domain-containing protein [Calditrichales bacterium]